MAVLAMLEKILAGGVCVGVALLLWSVGEYAWLFLNRRGFTYRPRLRRKRRERAAALLRGSLRCIFVSAGGWYLLACIG